MANAIYATIAHVIQKKNMFSIFSIVHMGLRHASMIFLLKSNKRKKTLDFISLS